MFRSRALRTAEHIRHSRTASVSQYGLVSDYVMVHGVLPGVERSDVERTLAALPTGPEGVFDEELAAVVVRIKRAEAHADLINAVHSVLSSSHTVAGGPTNDDSIRRYLPEKALCRAAWDVLNDDFAICTVCSYVVNGPATRSQMDSHTDQIHGGRGRYDWDEDD
ncbi:MAG: hypothetical protein NVS3B21_10940 [Acidimicrobiales bacterium]